MTISIVFLFLSLFYLTFTLWVRHGVARLKNAPLKAIGELPTVSVYVPARNEEANLHRTLTSLENQTYPKEKLTVVMINDRSTDSTEEVMKEFASRNANFRLINIENLPAGIAPKKHALMNAIARTDSEIIVTTDADCIHSPAWLMNMISHFNDGVALVTALTVFDPDDYTVFHELHTLDFLSQAVVSAGAMGQGLPLMCSAPNLAYKRKVFNEVGGYGDSSSCVSGDDNLFLQNLVKNGNYKTAFALGKDTIVKSLPPKSVKGVWHQRLRWGTQGAFYPLKIKLAGAVVFLYYLSIVLSPLFYLLGVTLSVLLALGMVKVAADFFVIKYGFKVLGIKFKTKIFILLSLIHPLLIIATLLSSLTIPFDWKGSNLRPKVKEA
ncbi:MAG: glycosyltransferase [Bacteroidota bacterium]